MRPFVRVAWVSVSLDSNRTVTRAGCNSMQQCMQGVTDNWGMGNRKVLLPCAVNKYLGKGDIQLLQMLHSVMSLTSQVLSYPKATSADPTGDLRTHGLTVAAPTYNSGICCLFFRTSPSLTVLDVRLVGVPGFCLLDLQLLYQQLVLIQNQLCLSLKLPPAMDSNDQTLSSGLRDQRNMPQYESTAGHVLANAARCSEQGTGQQ